MPLVASDLVLAGAIVYPSLNDPPIGYATIVIHNGRISAAGNNERVKAPRAARDNRCRAYVGG